jgi:2-polyprenyl-3-methyl-5-hydroxy-6-metoxy-1,4-benzoquinol methylase
VYDKYQSRNPIARRLTDNFLDVFHQCFDQAGVTDVHEIGCGEGMVSAMMADWGATVRGCDFSRDIVTTAEQNFGARGIRFDVKSVYDLEAGCDSADLIVCCEVLEHVERPEEALRRLAACTRQWAILSVPREPIWRALNMVRGKYIGDWGNTPGHIQHWSRSGFIGLVGRHFEIVRVRSPFPWTMLLCKPLPGPLPEPLARS